MATKKARPLPVNHIIAALNRPMPEHDERVTIMQSVDTSRGTTKYWAIPASQAFPESAWNGSRDSCRDGIMVCSRGPLGIEVCLGIYCDEGHAPMRQED